MKINLRELPSDNPTAWSGTTTGYTRLDWADPLYPDGALPQSVKAAMAQQLEDSLSAHYPPTFGGERLKTVIASKLNKKYRAAVDPRENIHIIGGSEIGLLTSLFPFMSEGNEIMIIDPTYSPDFDYIAFAGLKAVSIPLHEDKNHQPDIADFESRLTQHTRAVLISQPNNPTGTVFSKPFLEQLS